MSRIVEKYAELPRVLRRPLWQWWHRMMNKYDASNEANFMNYGYQGLNGDPYLELHEVDETDRYCIQLYHHVVHKADLKDKVILEVGSGRGGGASFITRYLPKSYTGLDISSSSIDFCNNHYDVERLSFKQGFAEKLPFDENTFDFVVNVESARCYNDQLAFFKEVFRVLKPDGKLLLADMRYPNELGDLKKMLEDSGFHTEHETDISRNVVEALKRDSIRREMLIEQKAPRILQKSFKTFAGTIGTTRFNNFHNGIFQYWSFVLAKQV